MPSKSFFAGQSRNRRKNFASAKALPFWTMSGFLVYQALSRLNGFTKWCARSFTAAWFKSFAPELRKRSITSFKLYEKQVSGHHVQVDVKFLLKATTKSNDSNTQRLTMPRASGQLKCMLATYRQMLSIS